jgi:FtsX-like permease family protein
MIRLGMRLALAGGRIAIARLSIIAVAVAVGVGLLLSALAGINAVQRQDAGYAWLNSAVTDVATGPQAADPAWWVLREDYFDGRSIARIDVAVTGPHGPVPPGLSALPGPGAYYVSPALAELLASTPAGQLGDRFPGRPAGVLGREALASPDLLVAVVGRTPAEAQKLPGATRITRFVSTEPQHCLHCYVGTDNDGMVLILSVVLAALLFPLLIFIGTATRLSAARREQRLAAMRLVGATPRQVATLATIESLVAAVAGTVLGFGLFAVLRPALTQFSFTGMRFFPSDFVLTWPGAVIVLIGVPVGAALAARLALRRVRVSPLGVMRRVTPKPPRAWRLVPLLAGLGELTWFVGRRPATTNGQTAAYLGGILVVMIGVVAAGPWLTMAGSRLLARRARRPAGMIAGRRLADDPRAGFRSISGLALALFVSSVATGVITTYVAERGDGPGGSIVHDLMSVTAWTDHGDGPLDPAAVPSALSALPGVKAVILVRQNPQVRADPQSWPALVSCADLARVPGSGRCPAGATAAQVFPDLVPPPGGALALGSTPQWPAAPDVPLDKQPLVGVDVATDGSPAALERSRTLLENAFPEVQFAATEGDFRNDTTRLLVQLQRLADIVIIASLVIAGCSLAVSITGGLNERKQPFAMLRLAGLRLGELRRVVTLESAVPLLAVSAVAIAAGFLSAELFLKSQLDYTLRPPGPGYYVITLGGLVVSLALIASTMPLLRRLTGPETARND